MLPPRNNSKGNHNLFLKDFFSYSVFTTTYFTSFAVCVSNLVLRKISAAGNDLCYFLSDFLPLSLFLPKDNLLFLLLFAHFKMVEFLMFDATHFIIKQLIKTI